MDRLLLSRLVILSDKKDEGKLFDSKQVFTLSIELFLLGQLKPEGELGYLSTWTKEIGVWPTELRL